MKILALESSAKAASVAVCEDEELIAQTILNTGFTHSQTLLPMLEDLLNACKLRLADMELIAVAAGPGSFTGLRIGVSAAKGLSWATGLPCAACSTLESMAWTVAHCAREVCALMDARRGQVYHARFRSDGKALTRLSPDQAISLEELAQILRAEGAPQLLVGDGARLGLDYLDKAGIPVTLAPPHLRMQSAWGVARCALEAAKRGETLPGEALVPTYLRLSQAERERLERKEHTG
jgi:tRNA threonylcarbamoyladenosine biosynthesis protein TsaB